MYKFKHAILAFLPVVEIRRLPVLVHGEVGLPVVGPHDVVLAKQPLLVPGDGTVGIGGVDVDRDAALLPHDLAVTLGPEGGVFALREDVFGAARDPVRAVRGGVAGAEVELGVAAGIGPGDPTGRIISASAYRKRLKES